MSDQANTRHSSSDDAWFTPPAIIEAARATMDGIDLDPASCAKANEHVRASRFLDKDENGFGRPWSGKVFLNPPGGVCDSDGLRVVRGKKGEQGCEVTGACGLPPGHAHRKPLLSAAKAWWEKLATQWAAGAVECAVFIGFSIEILQTTQNGMPAGVPSAVDPTSLLCFPKTRLAFLQEEDGKLVPVKGNTHASVIVGLGLANAANGSCEIVGWEERFREHFAPIGAVRT